jgi:hypothetical protein
MSALRQGLKREPSQSRTVKEALTNMYLYVPSNRDKKGIYRGKNAIRREIGKFEITVGSFSTLPQKLIEIFPYSSL